MIHITIKINNRRSNNLVITYGISSEGVSIRRIITTTNNVSNVYFNRLITTCCQD